MGLDTYYSAERLAAVAQSAYREERARDFAAVLGVQFRESVMPVPINPTLAKIPSQVSQFVWGTLSNKEMKAEKSAPHSTVEHIGQVLEGRVIRLDLNGDTSTSTGEPTIAAKIYMLTLMGSNQIAVNPENIQWGVVVTGEGHEAINGNNQCVLFDYNVQENANSVPSVNVKPLELGEADDYLVALNLGLDLKQE